MADLNPEDIDKVINEAAGMGGEEVTNNEKCELEISEDGMTAYITFTRPAEGGEYLSVEEIRAQIAAAGITYGLDDDLIELLALPTKTYDYSIEIAHGKPVQWPVDGYVEYTYDPNREVNVPEAKEDGSVDLFNLNLIQNVKKDEVLAVCHEMVPGEDGVDVYGNVVECGEGKVVALPQGKGIIISDDGLTATSEMDGQLIYDNGTMVVQNIYEVPADVNASTGNITFNGSVHIKGSVKSGFKVIAEGNVEVEGVVEAAEVESGGDVIITGGIQGNKVGHVKATGNIVSKFLENAQCEAGGDVVADAIMHSDVRCSGMVKAEGKKGLIVGGVVDAYKGIRAKTIGSHMATPTELNVGTSLEIGNKYKEIQDAISVKKKDLLQSEQIINILAAKRRELGGLPREKEDMLLKALKTREYLISTIPLMEQKVQELRDVIDHVSKYSIEATDKVYTGVKINIANEKKLISEELTHCKLTKRDGEIRVDIL